LLKRDGGTVAEAVDMRAGEPVVILCTTTGDHDDDGHGGGVAPDGDSCIVVVLRMDMAKAATYWGGRGR